MFRNSFFNASVSPEQAQAALIGSMNFINETNSTGGGTEPPPVSPARYIVFAVIVLLMMCCMKYCCTEECCNPEDPDLPANIP